MAGMGYGLAGLQNYGQGTQNRGGWSNLSSPTPGTQRITRPSPFGHGYQSVLDTSTGNPYARRRGGSGGMAGFAPHVGTQHRPDPYQNPSEEEQMRIHAALRPPTAPTTQQETGGMIGPLPQVDRIPPHERVDDTQAAAEAYARAKDVAGRQGRAAMDALMDVQGARGIVGSGLGVNEAGGVIQEGAAQLGEFNRQQLINRIENERRRQEMIYQGGITQRGQDINQRQQELERRRYNAGRLRPGEYAY